MSQLITERIGESLARLISRRKFIRWMATGAFGMVAAGMAELTFLPNAQAKNYCKSISSDSTCFPPSGKYCDAINPAYCTGANCSGGCTIDKTFWVTGCWCTLKHCDVSQRVFVFYECCDCRCQGQGCGCHKSVSIPGVSC